MRVFFDAETVPSQVQFARDQVRQTIKPPATLKKAESIASWWENESPAAIEEAWRKQAFDASVGELISISWATDADTEAHCVIRGPGESERDLLAEFFKRLQLQLEDGAIRDHRGDLIFDDGPFFIAHNAAFDLGFIWRRSIILGIRPPFRVPGPNAREPKDYGCTMRAWSGWKDAISLDRLCRALGVPTPKGDLDGSKIIDAWLAGELDRIAEYNRDDVIATRACWYRLNWEVAA